MVRAEVQAMTDHDTPEAEVLVRIEVHDLDALLAERRAAWEFIESHDGDRHADASWPCDGKCVQARNLRAALAESPR